MAHTCIVFQKYSILFRMLLDNQFTSKFFLNTSLSVMQFKLCD